MSQVKKTFAALLFGLEPTEKMSHQWKSEKQQHPEQCSNLCMEQMNLVIYHTLCLSTFSNSSFITGARFIVSENNGRHSLKTFKLRYHKNYRIELAIPAINNL